jgi:hypothetical protein
LDALPVLIVDREQPRGTLVDLARERHAELVGAGRDRRRRSPASASAQAWSSETFDGVTRPSRLALPTARSAALSTIRWVGRATAIVTVS